MTKRHRYKDTSSWAKDQLPYVIPLLIAANQDMIDGLACTTVATTRPRRGVA